MIPLFAQWIDIDIQNKRLFNSLHKFLQDNLRDDVLYIAVSQGDVGMYPNLDPHQRIDHVFPNVLVMSAGGFGHVILPLLKDEKEYLQVSSMKNLTDISFYGAMYENRKKMIESLNSSIKEHNNLTLVTGTHADNYIDAIAGSKFFLAPRGYGRSSYRLAEIIQIGRLPIVMYEDWPWIPYQNSKNAVINTHFNKNTKYLI